MSGLIIGHNLGAMSALSALNANSNALNSALQQLSTGKKINSAADDASGYAISQKMQGQINGLNQASQNAQDGISMIQTASGALGQTTSILQQMRQLAVQASNGTTTQTDRMDLQAEFNQLADQINNIAHTSQFNTQNLLDATGGTTGTDSAGNADSTFTFQIGANTNQTMQVSITSMDTDTLGITGAAGSTDTTSAKESGGTGSGAQYGTDDAANGLNFDVTNGSATTEALDITSIANATTAITTLDNAIQTVTTQAANLGAVQNRLQSTISNLDASSQNLTTADSDITDTDMASEMASYTQNSVLQQAAVSMLAQANQQPQLVLKLLG